MAADPELLLTVNGQDVTPYVRNWSSVQMTDAWNQIPSLTFTLRQTFTEAASAQVNVYADIRLVKLTTGAVLFEGVVASPPELHTEDPHFIVSSVTAAGYQSLFDTWLLQTARSAPNLDPGVIISKADYVASTLLPLAFGDIRVPSSVTAYPNDATYTEWWFQGPANAVGWPQFTPLSQALLDLANGSLPGKTGTGMLLTPNPVIKMVPGVGLVICSPTYAYRGAASVQLTPAGAGAPADVVYRPGGEWPESAVLATTSLRPQHLTVNTSGGTTRTNGYLVTRGTVDVSWLLGSGDAEASQVYFYGTGGGATVASWEVTTGDLTADIMVGHSLTFSHPYWGTVTGTVTSARTTFRDGVYDTSSVSLPYFLDSGRLVDGTWSLDASAATSLPRRIRRSTLTVVAGSGTATSRRTFIGSARQYGLGLHG